MTTPALPEISEFTHAQLLALREAVDGRLAEIRADFIEQAAILGLAVMEGGAKKRKRRSNAHKEQE